MANKLLFNDLQNVSGTASKGFFSVLRREEIMKFWTKALKYHAPATISGFVFFYLVKLFFANEIFLMKHPFISIMILIIIANFCAFLLYRSTSSKAAKNEARIVNNKISENEIGESVELSTEMESGIENSVSIEKNEITGNKIKGNLFVGAKKNV